MGGKSTPDFGDIAASQGEDNRTAIRDQLYANRPSQYTPFGYSAWQASPYTDPATGQRTTQWTQTTGLRPELQSLLNKHIAIQGGQADVAGMMTGRLGSEFRSPIDWRGLMPMGQVPTAQYTLPENTLRSLDYRQAGPTPQAQFTRPTNTMSTLDFRGGAATPALQRTEAENIRNDLNYRGVAGIDDPYQTRQRAEDAVYNQAMSRLDPAFQSRRQQLETKMRNQGLGPEDAAWRAQMEQLNQQETDATNQAIWSATGAGQAEAGQMFGQQLGRRQQAVGEANTMADFYNRAQQQKFEQALGANQANFGQQMARRQLTSAERQAQADFYNRAQQQMFEQALGANQANFGQQMGMRQQAVGELNNRADFYNQAQQQAFNQAMAANQANFDQSMRGSAYANQIRQQQITEAMQKRGYSLNEINALMSGGQVGMPQMPSFVAAGAATPAPIYTGAADQASIRNAQRGGVMQGAIGGATAGAALGNPWAALGGAGLGGLLGAFG